MAKPKKITLNESVNIRLQEVGRELQKRGATEFNISDLLDLIVNNERTCAIIDDYVNSHTPESYKIKCLLDIPEEREKIIAFTKNKSFGFNFESALSGNSQKS
jgi:hypothetical protein